MLDTLSRWCLLVAQDPAKLSWEPLGWDSLEKANTPARLTLTLWTELPKGLFERESKYVKRTVSVLLPSVDTVLHDLEEAWRLHCVPQWVIELPTLPPQEKLQALPDSQIKLYLGRFFESVVGHWDLSWLPDTARDSYIKGSWAVPSAFKH